MTISKKPIMNISITDLYQMSLNDKDCHGSMSFLVNHRHMEKGEYSINETDPKNPCINVQLTREDVIRLKKYCEDALNDNQ